MKKFLKVAVAGLLASQLSYSTTAFLAQESSSEDSSQVEEVSSEETDATEEEGTSFDPSEIIANVEALVTEEAGTPATTQAKKYYIDFLNQFQVGDIYYGYDLGPSKEEIAVNFDGGVEPQAYELSETETILSYVYNGEEDISQAMLEEESEAASDEESTEELTDGDTVVTEEPEEKLATLYVYFYEDEAILVGLVNNYHDIDYDTFMAAERVNELLESNATVEELAAENPVFTGHAMMFHDEKPVEVFTTFSGTNYDDTLIEFFFFEDGKITQVYDEPLGAGGAGFDYLMYYKLSAYADGMTNEEARIPTADDAEATEEVTEPAEEEPAEEETTEESAAEETESSEESAAEESTDESSEESVEESESTTDESDSTEE